MLQNQEIRVKGDSLQGGMNAVFMPPGKRAAPTIIMRAAPMILQEMSFFGAFKPPGREPPSLISPGFEAPIILQGDLLLWSRAASCRRRHCGEKGAACRLLYRERLDGYVGFKRFTGLGLDSRQWARSRRNDANMGLFIRMSGNGRHIYQYYRPRLASNI